MRELIAKFLLALARRVAKAAFDAAVAEATRAAVELANERRDLRDALDTRNRG